MYKDMANSQTNKWTQSTVFGNNSTMTEVSEKSVASGTLAWPRGAIPTLLTATRAYLDDRDFRGVYRSKRHHSVHLYEYAATIRLDDRVYELRPGDLTVTPAFVGARYHVPEPGHHLCVHWLFYHDPQTPPTEDVMELPLHLPAAAQQRGRGFAEQLHRIIALHAEGEVDPLAEMSSRLAFQRLLIGIAMAGRDTREQSDPAPSDAAVDTVAALVQHRLDHDLRVPTLAKEVGLSQNYLARRFKDRYGQTIPRYILRCRIEHAHLLLTTTNLPIGNIAARVGLPNPQHFNKQFRRLMGRSPTAVRQSA